jgi:4-hydroxybenzoate polyprenyltransferase
MAQPDKIAGGVVIISGVLVLTILAGTNENLGKVLLVIMFGFLLLWLMNGGSGLINKWIGVTKSGGGTVIV